MVAISGYFQMTRTGEAKLRSRASCLRNRQVLLARHVASTCKSQNVNAVYTAHHLLGVWLLDGGVDESITMELRPEFPAYKVEEALNTLWPTSRAEDLALLAALKDS